MIIPNTGELFATISNSSHYEIQISNRNAILQRQDLSGLSLKVKVGGVGEVIHAHFKETRKQDIGNTTKDVHVFEVAKENADLAKLSLDETRVCEIVEHFEQEHYIIPKTEIAFLRTKVLRAKGWKGLIKDLWPGAELVMEGPYSVAVAMKAK